MPACNIEAHLDARLSRRMKSDDRYLARRERREEAAELMIGELCRDGRTIYYVCPQAGRYREGSRWELVDFLIRNNFV